MRRTLHIPSGSTGRLDKMLAGLCPDLSRARLQALIGGGAVQVNGQSITDVAYRLRGGETIGVIIPAAAPSHHAAEAIPLAVCYEDEWLMVINKPAGLVVHPAAGHRDGTLVNALLAHGAGWSGIGGVERPGIVHRLDKDTSGLLVVAKHDAAHQALATQFADRSLSRTYLAFVYGAPATARGTCDGPIGRDPRQRQRMAVTPQGKPAVTHYEVIKRFGDPTRPIASLVRCTLETGRTHQIRVHLARLGHPLLGDGLYAGRHGRGLVAKLLAPHLTRQALHATSLRLRHPADGRLLSITAPLPKELEKLKKILSSPALANSARMRP